MNQDIINEYMSIVGKLDHLLQEGVAFTHEEGATLQHLARSAETIIHDLAIK